MADCPKRRMCSRSRHDRGHATRSAAACVSLSFRSRCQKAPAHVLRQTSLASVLGYMTLAASVNTFLRRFSSQQKGQIQSVKKHRQANVPARNRPPHAPRFSAFPDSHPCSEGPLAGFLNLPEVCSRPDLASGGALYMLTRLRLSSAFGKFFCRLCQTTPAASPPAAVAPQRPRRRAI